ncbi:MAG: sigma 54-interacting transcriptional regulator [Kofleriaceae bacterium]
MSREPSPHTLPVVQDGRVVGLRRRRLRVEVTAGPDRRLVRELADDDAVIGTHPACQVVLTDPTASRQHLAIELVPDGWRVRDLDSTNGAYLGPVRFHDVTITADTTVRLGDTTLRIRPLADTVDLPVPTAAGFGGLRGTSVAMRRVFDVLARLAPSELTVLITGESGTGKELTARALHDASPRRAGPFVVLDGAAQAATLIESALFGHARGAFTGADRARIGAFEAAGGGTLFLDEIGELPLELQPRLLGAIERREVTPVGTTAPRPVDVRVLAATNRDLRREINRGTFREDLYFRLAVGTVHLPPLRDRPEDIALYVADFVAEQAGLGHPVTLGADAIAGLARHRWPGNVRELRNALERAAALGQLELAPTAVAADELRVTVDPSHPYKAAKAALVEQFERAYVAALIAGHAGNITRAARAAELDRVYLLRLLDRFGLRPGR